MTTLAKDRIKFLLLCFVYICWTCIPNSINVRYSIELGNARFQLSIIVGAIILLVIIPLVNRRLFKDRRLSILLVLFCFFSFLTSLAKLKGNSDLSLWETIDELLVFVLPILFVKSVLSIQNERYKQLFMYAMIVVGAVVAMQVFMLSLFGKWLGWQNSIVESRGFTTIGAATASADFVFMSFVVCYITAMKTKRKILFLFLALFLLSMIVMQTRSAILLTALFLIYAILKEKLSTKLKLIILGAVILIGIAVLYPSFLSNFISRVFVSNSDTFYSGIERKRLATVGLNVFFDNPLFGGGGGLILYRISRITYAPYYIGNSHNQWVALLAEHGIIGVVLFLLIVFTFLRKTEWNKYSKLAVAAVLLMLLLGFFFETFITTDIRMTTTFWGLVLCMKHYSTANESISRLRKQNALRYGYHSFSYSKAMVNSREAL
ncbi:O-antigen ligase family protein [bacterium]|nr:O-antigen ligase family protein [bacterium]